MISFFNPEKKTKLNKSRQRAIKIVKDIQIQILEEDKEFKFDETGLTDLEILDRKIHPYEYFDDYEIPLNKKQKIESAIHSINRERFIIARHLNNFFNIVEGNKVSFILFGELLENLKRNLDDYTEEIYIQVKN